MRNILMLKETICAFCTKKIKLTDLRIIKVESAYFASQKEFCSWGGGQKRAGVCTISQTLNKSYTIQGYFLHLAINCFYYKKNGHK